MKNKPPPNIQYSQHAAHYPLHMERHAIPLDDRDAVGALALHYASRDCWCYTTEQNPGAWMHNALDCREIMERQGIETGLFWITVGAIDKRAPRLHVWE